MTGSTGSSRLCEGWLRSAIAVAVGENQSLESRPRIYTQSMTLLLWMKVARPVGVVPTHTPLDNNNGLFGLLQRKSQHKSQHNKSRRTRLACTTLDARRPLAAL